MSFLRFVLAIVLALAVPVMMSFVTIAAARAQAADDALTNSGGTDVLLSASTKTDRLDRSGKTDRLDTGSKSDCTAAACPGGELRKVNETVVPMNGNLSSKDLGPPTIRPAGAEGEVDEQGEEPLFTLMPPTCDEVECRDA